MRETWYVLEDGTAVNPAEVVPGESGVLRHKSGAAIAMRGQVPSTRGVDPDEERAKAATDDASARELAEKAAAEAAAAGAPAKRAHDPDEKAKDLKPEEQKRGYKTRETKGD